MLAWIIKIAILSLIFIFLVHHLISFFKSTLTVPKIKDLVNSPNQKYADIFETLANPSAKSTKSYTAIDLLPTDAPIETASSSMKDELKSFLKQQLTSGQ